MRQVVGLVLLAWAGCSSENTLLDPTLACDANSGGGGGAPGGARVLAVNVPSQPEDVVPLTVTLDRPGVPASAMAVDVSSDDGAHWRPAHLAAAPPAAAGSSNGDGTEVGLLWSSLPDVGFHAPVQARLRLRAQGGPACVVTMPLIDNLRAAVRHVEHYMVSYGAFTPETVALAKKYDLVILHPQHTNFDRAQIRDLQLGVDPNDPADDVLVLGYVSVGEDMRSANLSDVATAKDARFRGDASGPRVDPRGPNAAGKPLVGVDPSGAPSNGGTGWAAYYLDDNSLQASAAKTGDGKPDRNPLFGSFFVNAGAPGWFEEVDGMLHDSPDQLSGLREVMTTDYGRGLGCDGVFLDTIDTAAPNEFTKFGFSPNPTRFEWTAPGFSSFIARVHHTYPNKLVLQNRGLFFFDPRHPHYQFTTRGFIDLALFESYRLNSNVWEQWNPYIYPDNRYNLAPKLMAEANRSDGFKVLSLGYAEGPGLTPDTLVGKSTAGMDSLLEDIRVTQDLAGFRHYLTNRMVDLVNTFVMDHGATTDTTPPAWTSTFNDHLSGPVAAEPTPRVGIQQAEPGPDAGQITVRWDVAMDRNRVGYAAYIATTPFDFAADPMLHSATRVVIEGSVPAAYTTGIGPTIYANQATLSGLVSGQTYRLVIRAFDDSPARNEETNTTVLTARAR